MIQKSTKHFATVYFLLTSGKNFKKNWLPSTINVKYSNLKYLRTKLFFRRRIESPTSASTLQTIQVLKVLCKRVPQNLCCWNNVERKFSTHIFTFSKHCYVLSLEILRISLWKVAEMKRLYHFFEIF